MKIKLEVNNNLYDELKLQLERLGFVIDDDSDFIHSQKNTYKSSIRLWQLENKLNPDKFLYRLKNA